MGAKAAAAMAVLLLFAGLAGPLPAAIPPAGGSTVPALIEERIDGLAALLAADGVPIPESFKEASGLSGLLAALADPAGPYAGTFLARLAATVEQLSSSTAPDGQAALEDALNRLTALVLVELLKDGSLDPALRSATEGLLARIPGGLEAYEEAGGGPGFGHGQGGGPDDRDRRIREARFLQNQTPPPPVPAAPPAEPAPQGFQPPQEHLVYTPDPPGDAVDPVDWDDGSGGNDPRNGFNDPPPAAGFSFPFYGKEYDTFLVGTHGNIVLSDGTTAGDTSWWPADPANPSGDPERNLQTVPRIAPLWTDVSPAFRGEVKIEAADTYYRASWDGVGTNPPSGTASFSATLYENGWIAFSYGDVSLMGTHPNSNIFYGETGYHALVGLSPGDGSALDHPGPGEARTWTAVDLSGTGGSYDYTNYEGVYEWWETLDGSSDGHAFDLADSYLVFRPGSPKYAPTAGTRDMFVDIATVDQAVESTLADPGLLASVDAGDYAPGAFAAEGETNGFPGSWSGYRYGLQTVGQDADGNPNVYTNAATLEGIHQSGFLAYAVQVEEDRVNREILAMHRERLKGDLRRQVDHALEYGDIRVRDDILTQKADAQAGRVLKDRNGHWVRVQQYVLRPDEQTVQVLNVSLRDGGGDLAGISTMDWQTRFTESVDGVNLKALPWSQWLDTQERGAGRFVTTTAGAPELGEMSVAFTNPAEESLKEARWFAEKSLVDSAPAQAICQERLTLVSTGLNGTFDYAGGNAPLMDGQYRVVEDPAGSSPHPRGFHYAMGTGGSERNVNVAFFVVGDGDRADNQGLAAGDYSGVAFQDIWDALRVNEPGGPQIGENNLEIAMDVEKQVFSRPVDVVTIPMSRMLWK